jgi:transcriptional regulator with XRE-family HTH domain
MPKSQHTREYRVFLQLLRQARREAGMTQTDLAKRMRCTQSFISKCERGERRIDLVELRRMCRALRISIVEFVQLFDDKLG